MEPGESKPVLHEVRDIANVSKITGKTPSDEQLTCLESIPGMPLLKHSSDYVGLLKTAFFNKNKRISPEELINTKKAVYRARTEPASAFTKKDVLSQVVSSMTDEQRARVSVKAYVSGYQVHQGRVIPGKNHDQDNAPKAVRIGPKF
ncbi:hypothetical protein ACQUW5_15050 [Legionella sp. CNM-1927-20]|uniref:hypothetical protein n=1 Tax=Legionella sp. CNM-1927-20 TaxID=3422221 RepID=UPI00403B04F5